MGSDDNRGEELLTLGSTFNEGRHRVRWFARLVDSLPSRCDHSMGLRTIVLCVSSIVAECILLVFKWVGAPRSKRSTCHLYNPDLVGWPWAATHPASSRIDANPLQINILFTAWRSLSRPSTGSEGD